MTPRHEMWLGCVVENHIKYIKIIMALHGYLIYVCIWKCGSCTYVASSTCLRARHRWDQSGLNFREIEDSELLLLYMKSSRSGYLHQKNGFNRKSYGCKSAHYLWACSFQQFLSLDCYCKAPDWLWLDIGIAVSTNLVHNFTMNIPSWQKNVDPLKDYQQQVHFFLWLENKNIMSLKLLFMI